MSPSIEYVNDGEDIRIRDVEQIEWVEWSRAQALDGKVQIESHFTDREHIHNREITEVDLETLDTKAECVRQLRIAFGMLFDDDFVQTELVDERGLIEELAERAMETG